MVERARIDFEVEKAYRQRAALEDTIKQQDFEKYKGNRTKIKTSRPLNGQKNFTGILLGMCDRQVKLQIGGQTIAIPFQDISRARLAK